MPIGNINNQQNAMNNQLNGGNPQTEIVAGVGVVNGEPQNNENDVVYAYAGNHENLLEAAYEKFYEAVGGNVNNNNNANNNQQSYYEYLLSVLENDYNIHINNDED